MTVNRTAAGPGLQVLAHAKPRIVEATAPAAVWWFDYGACEVVRTRDGRRWDVRDVPELARSSRERNAVDVDVLDAWVLAQPDLK